MENSGRWMLQHETHPRPANDDFEARLACGFDKVRYLERSSGTGPDCSVDSNKVKVIVSSEKDLAGLLRCSSGRLLVGS
jgi:hypothetical protein